MKTCSRCGKAKAFEDFNIDHSQDDHRNRACRECYRIIQKNWADKNRDKVRDYRRASRLRNLEKIRARNRKYMRENRDKAREWNRRDRERHPERVRAYLKKYYETNGDKMRARINELRRLNPEIEAGRQTKKRYGIDLNSYRKLLAAQNSRCAICRRPDPGVPGRKRLFVDHDHITHVVRGLLCYRCNTGCGNFKDSAKLLLAAANYLERREI